MSSLDSEKIINLGLWMEQTFLERTGPPAFAGRNPWVDAAVPDVLQKITLSPRHFLITRKEIMNGQVGPVVQRLMDLTDTPLACAQHTSRLRLAFVGYHKDKQEVGQIRAIAAFFQKVNEQWPYWMHFLDPQPDDIATLLSLIFIPSEVRVEGMRVYARIPLDPPGLKVFKAMARSTLVLHDAMAAPASVTHRMGARWHQAFIKVVA